MAPDLHLEKDLRTCTAIYASFDDALRHHGGLSFAADNQWSTISKASRALLDVVGSIRRQHTHLAATNSEAVSLIRT